MTYKEGTTSEIERRAGHVVPSPQGGGGSGCSGGESGITLIEVLVALAITALALAIAGGSFRLLARSGDRGAALIARHEVLSRGLDVLRRDIERLERVAWKRGESAEFVFRGDAGRLAFVVVEPPFPAEAGPYFVLYKIEQRRDGAVLTRERAPFQPSAADLVGLKTADSAAVLEGPFRLRFVYLERKEGRERWVTEWSNLSRIPEIMGLELSGLTGEPTRIVFRPRIDAERSCVQEGADSCTVGTQGALASKSGADSSPAPNESAPQGRN
jgi:prepilin-type N-terminal cleavage/methylation domain-containing protein